MPYRCSTFGKRRPLAPYLAFVSLLALGPGAHASLDPSKDLSQFIQQSWQNEQGLPENSVTAIAQTADGYLWLGTESGLARFDGLRFTVYDKSSTPGLTGNFITCLLVDHEGTLWIGTHDAGLTRFRNGNFAPFRSEGALGSESILSLYEDVERHIWVGTDGGGLSRIQSGVVQTITKRNGLSDDAVLSISGERNGTLWAGTRNGLNQIYEVASSATRQRTASVGTTSAVFAWAATELYGWGCIRTDCGVMSRARESNLPGPRH